MMTTFCSRSYFNLYRGRQANQEDPVLEYRGNVYLAVIQCFLLSLLTVVLLLEYCKSLFWRKLAEGKDYSLSRSNHAWPILWQHWLLLQLQCLKKEDSLHPILKVAGLEESNTYIKDKCQAMLLVINHHNLLIDA